MERKIEITHMSVEMNCSFESFTKNLEQILNRFDPEIYQIVTTNPRLAEERLKKIAGDAGLMLYDVHDHGKLLNMLGIPTKKGKQYIMGNPLIAIQMTQHDFRAGLYAPIRIFVHEASEKSIKIEYDLPSTLFGQFNIKEITEVAKGLDAKLEKLLKRASES